MGGGEFAAWDSSIQTNREAERQFSALAQGCRRLSENLEMRIGCSAGIAVSRRTRESFTDLYKRADQALYRAKSQGKGCFAWAEE